MKAMLLAVVIAIAVAAPAPAATPVAELATGIAAYRAQRFVEARAAFKALADQGSAIGETMLGVMYARGLGAAADPATAAGYWLRAANRGYPPAQFALAQALAGGRGVALDRGAAWVWANLAARGGDAATRRAAERLAAELRPAFDTAELARLDRRLANWRPWAREQ